MILTPQKCKVTTASGFVGARSQDTHYDNTNEIKLCSRGSGKYIPKVTKLEMNEMSLTVQRSRHLRACARKSQLK